MRETENSLTNQGHVAATFPTFCNRGSLIAVADFVDQTWHAKWRTVQRSEARSEVKQIKVNTSIYRGEGKKDKERPREKKKGGGRSDRGRVNIPRHRFAPAGIRDPAGAAHCQSQFLHSVGKHPQAVAMLNSNRFLLDFFKKSFRLCA